MRVDAYLSQRISANTLLSYAAPFVATGVSLVACRALSPIVGDQILYTMLFPVVAFSAWYCGVGPSILTIVIAILGTKYWFFPPTHSLRLPNTAQLIGLLAFLC